MIVKMIQKSQKQNGEMQESFNTFNKDLEETNSTEQYN